MHVHARSAGKEAKVWLKPRVAIADSRGFNSHELATIVSIIETNRTAIEQAWHDHFGE